MLFLPNVIIVHFYDNYTPSVLYEPATSHLQILALHF